MTILTKDSIKVCDSFGRSYSKLQLYLKCDQCDKQYLCPDKTKNRALASNHHFCSKTCSIASQTNGILRTCRESTCLKRYGSPSFGGTDAHLEKFRETCLQNFGAPSPLQDSGTLKKIEKTNLIRYGSKTFAGTEAHKVSADWKKASQQAWQTKIRNSKNGQSQSKMEDKFYKVLIKIFGETDIERQKYLAGQWADFYIESKNIYIQFDGVYWHGLNRKFSEIKLQKTAQDRKIYKQILKDRKLNRYCKKNDLKLLRITDNDFKSMSIQDVEERINACI